MDFLSTILMMAAALFGLNELAAGMEAWWNADSALEAAATIVGAEYPDAAALVASTTDAVRDITEAAESW
jgi:hypothetical protein